MYHGLIGKCSEKRFSRRTSCESGNYTWTNEQMSFDNILKGMSTLFVLSTMDDWFIFTRKLIKLEETSDLIATVFIVSFIFVMGFVMLNVFVGFIIVVFHKEKEKSVMFKTLDKSAQECIFTALNENSASQYNVPSGPIQQILWNIVTSTVFQTISLLLIVLNTIFLVTKHYQQNKMAYQIQRYANLTFTTLFTLEIIIKLAAFSISGFIRDSWSVFDAIVIFGSWIDVILDELKVPFINLSIFRLFRVARLVKLVGKGGNLRQLFNTFIKSMKSVPSIAFMLGLLIYLYAIIGIEVDIFLK